MLLRYFRWVGCGYAEKHDDFVKCINFIHNVLDIFSGNTL